MRKVCTLLLLLYLFINPVLSQQNNNSTRPQTTPLLKAYKDVNIPPAGTERIGAEEPTGTLDLVSAIRLALLQNPELKVYSYEIRAREARALQAGLLPNPEFDVEIENFGGNRSVSGFGASETTLAIGQLIELAGKRSKRSRVAMLESDLAVWDYETKKLDVYFQVAQNLVDVLAAQERVALQQELVNLAEQFLRSIERRVKAGKVSPAEASRATVELSSAQIELENARRALQAARKRLAATWGSSEPRFEKVVGSLETVSEPPPLQKLRVALGQNPDIARWVVEMRHRESVLALEKAGRIPDPIISGGVRHFNEVGDQGFVVNLSIPLPIFDRNQGAIQEAELLKRQAEYQKKSVQIAIETYLSQVYQSLSASYFEAFSLRDKILPQAQQAFDIINEGYLSGRFRFLDVLDARRTMFEARSRYLEALKNYHQLTAELERLISQDLNSIR